MASFKDNIREILYNDTRLAGHGVAVFEQFLEFDAVVGAFVNGSMMPSPSATSPVAFNAGATAPPVPDVPPVAQPQAEPSPPLPPTPPPPVSEIIAESPPQTGVTRTEPLPPTQAVMPQAATPELPSVQPVTPPATSALPQVPITTQPVAEVPELPTLQSALQSFPSPDVLQPKPVAVQDSFVTSTPVPELPPSEPIQSTPSPDVATVPVASAQAPPVPDVPQTVAPTSPPMETAAPRTERLSHDDVLELISRPYPPVPPVPPIERSQKTPYRSSTPDDPTGQREYAQEKGTEQVSMTEILDSILQTQSRISQKRYDAESLTVDMLERTARDVGSLTLRMRALTAAHQRSVTTLTDTNVGY